MEIGNIEIKKMHILGLVIGILILIAGLVFYLKSPMIYFLIGLSLTIAVLPFIVTVMSESSVEKENNEMFLEFSRNLVENVKAGTPISKGIINLRDKYYGSLTPYIQKLANQIALGIPVDDALNIFARDVNSKVVMRAVTLIGQAEKAGGDIENVLESVAQSVSEVEKLKKERKSAIYSLVVQGYIIFFVFIAIMLILRYSILPMASSISATTGSSAPTALGSFEVGKYTAEQVSAPILYLLVVQGFFTGLVIGKLAEGNIKAGIKHSFFMVALSLLIYTGAGAFF